MGTRCLRPVEAWPWAPRGCHVAVAVHNKIHLRQWALASVAGHEVLRSVLDLVICRMLAMRMYSPRHERQRGLCAHRHGASSLHRGHLALRRPASCRRIWPLDKIPAWEAQQLRARGICIMTAEEMATSLVNIYGSQRTDLQSATCLSWTKQRTAFRLAQHGGDASNTPAGGAPSTPVLRTRTIESWYWFPQTV